MSTLSSANVTDINLVLKERTHMRLCINMLIFTHNLGNWLIVKFIKTYYCVPVRRNGNFQTPTSVPAVSPKRCHTLSKICHRQDYTVACLNYTLQTMMPLPGWPAMAPNAYDNNNCVHHWIKQNFMSSSQLSSVDVSVMYPVNFIHTWWSLCKKDAIHFLVYQIFNKK